MTEPDLRIAARVLRELSREIDELRREMPVWKRWLYRDPSDVVRGLAGLLEDRADTVLSGPVGEKADAEVRR